MSVTVSKGTGNLAIENAIFVNLVTRTGDRMKVRRGLENIFDDNAVGSQALNGITKIKL